MSIKIQNNLILFSPLQVPNKPYDEVQIVCSFLNSVRSQRICITKVLYTNATWSNGILHGSMVLYPFQYGTIISNHFNEGQWNPACFKIKQRYSSYYNMEQWYSTNFNMEQWYSTISIWNNVSLPISSWTNGIQCYIFQHGPMVLMLNNMDQ
jgi:hypothetical protein